jgi:tetratricopeptide (TPR) repeat protein
MEDLFEKVNRYFEGEMEAAEMQEFEAKCKHDPKIAAALQLWGDLENMDQTITAELDLREQLKGIHQKLYGEKPQGRKHFFLAKKYWFAAASVAALLILIAGMLILMLPGKQAGNEDLFSMYYHPEQLVQLSRSAGQQFTEAVHLFQQEDYAAAAASFSQLLAQDTTNYRLMLYKGLAHTGAGSFDRAITAFQEVLNADYNLYTGHARWFLTLVYLRKGKTAKTIENLEFILAAEGHPHKKEAAELLATLSKRD